MQDTNASGVGRHEYLFLVADNLTMTTKENVIAPTLPINDSQSVAGRGSTNISIVLGMHKFAIQATGAFVDMKKTMFPQPLPPNIFKPDFTIGAPCDSVYLPGGAPSGRVGGYLSTAAPPDESPAPTFGGFVQRPTKKNMRSMYTNFFADQINYTDFCLGWPRWLDDGIPEQAVLFKDPDPDGTYVPGTTNGAQILPIGYPNPTGVSASYRLYRGHIFDTSPVQGETPESQAYAWSFTFGVGEVI